MYFHKFLLDAPPRSMRANQGRRNKFSSGGIETGVEFVFAPLQVSIVSPDIIKAFHRWMEHVHPFRFAKVPRRNEGQ